MRDRIRQFLAQNSAVGRKVSANATNGGVEVLIYDVIDPWWGVSATAVADALKAAAGAPVTLRINSPGGDAFEGRAIASLIRSYNGPTRAIVDGVAASAASTIAIAAESLSMASGAFLMVHRAWSFAMGCGDDLRQTADLLDKVDGELVADYARRAKCELDVAKEWVAAETWFTGEEAVAAGLADAVVTDPAEFAAWNLTAFEHAPKALLDKLAGVRSMRRPRAADPAPGEAEPATPCEAIEMAIGLLQDAKTMLAVEEALEAAGVEPPEAPDPAATDAAQREVRAALERRLRLFAA